jgi:hypothetical protein
MNEKEKEKFVEEICDKILTYSTTAFEATDIVQRIDFLISCFFLARYIIEQLKEKGVSR